MSSSRFLVTGAEPEYTTGRSLLRLGDYEIVDSLATGGMAHVYLARHGKLAGLETPVVLKRILPHLARDEQFLDMFLDEARIVASLHHPNIVRIIEIGCSGEEYFLAMELVQGESLATLSQGLNRLGQTFPITLACHIVSQVASGLHYAHTLADVEGHPLGIVHRDVSPQNVLVSFEGAVKIIDFGVAKAMNRLSHTREGRAKGKVGYMAPEQARGEPVDGRTDVFAMGILLWELLRGQPLFRREDLIATTRAVMNEPHPRLSEVMLVPRQVEAIVDRALAKRPEARFPTAEAMARALQSFLGATDSGRIASAAGLARFMKDSFPEQRERWRRLMSLPLRASVRAHTPTPTPRPPAPVSQPDAVAVPAAPRVPWAWTAVGAVAAAALGAALVVSIVRPKRVAPAASAAGGPATSAPRPVFRPEVEAVPAPVPLPPPAPEVIPTPTDPPPGPDSAPAAARPSTKPAAPKRAPVRRDAPKPPTGLKPNPF